MIPMRFVDRSRIVTDWDCKRKRYLQYEFGGRGVVPDVTSLELFLGTTLHDALARIGDSVLAAEQVDIDGIASAAAASTIDTLSAVPVGEIPDPDTLTFAREQAALIEGLVRGFYRQVWPRLVPEGWRIVAVEREVAARLADTLTFMAKPDLILEDPEGNWWYVEYKSTSSKKSNWIDQWATAIQLHSSVRAVEETLGHEVTGVIVQGLYKGYESYGRQNSPFCYAYTRAASPPFVAEQVRYEYASGFRRSPTWERPGGVRAWVAGMSDEILVDQFPQVPPIFIKPEMVEAFFRQTSLREAQIMRGVDYITLAQARGADDHVTEALDETFPQSFDKCSPGWGRGCPYKRICHGAVDNPIESGYAWRVPHHAPEMEAQKE